ncbi:hypothetical protein BKP35_02620 [Anaerobacillus arseniciselenatis]|uniref:LysM domain-containing protein n=1 Tax=Anaerobacillus arseniciselenatis TaxID=85682 RepID=A0A1S2LUM8_9BACI|nr:M23 family metallopeptidase [Anaerobacillus arseniciselenatis]OIJ15900.1 hypothetical protein BKP35_02620 [Anaerobacillus arseniciselenatis]
MYDYIRRFLIVIAVALSIGLLFLSTTVSFAESYDKYERVHFIWPTEGLITDTFGTRNGKHYGIDIAAPRGTTVVSVNEGVVKKSYYSNTYGNVIFIEHQEGFETVYAHLDERLVEKGERVNEGEKIGTVGNTGRSSGDHLHFEVHDGNWLMSKCNAIDPFLVLSDELEKQQYQVASSSNISDELEVTNTTDMKGFMLVDIKDGDSLWSLAERYQVTIDEIKKWNELNTDNILANDQLKIVSKGNYVVQQGDTLWKISKQSGVSISEIKKMNDIKGDTIQVGSLLKVKN